MKTKTKCHCQCEHVCFCQSVLPWVHGQHGGGVWIGQGVHQRQEVHLRLVPEQCGCDTGHGRDQGAACGSLSGGGVAWCCRWTCCRSENSHLVSASACLIWYQSLFFCLVSTTTYWCLFCLANSSHFLVWWVLSLVWEVLLLVSCLMMSGHVSCQVSTVSCLLTVWGVLSLVFLSECCHLFSCLGSTMSFFFSGEYRQLFSFLGITFCLFSCLVSIVACFLIRWVLPLVCRLVSQISLSSTCKVLPANIVAVYLVSSNN